MNVSLEPVEKTQTSAGPVKTRDLNALLGRGRQAIKRAWRDWTRGRKSTIAGELDPDLAENDLNLVRRQIDACLEAKGGEVSARATAADLGRAYLDLTGKGKARFFELLAREYNIDRRALRSAARSLLESYTEKDQKLAEQTLRRRLTSPRIRLLKQFNSLEEGVKFLVDMRADLIRAKAKEFKNDPDIVVLDDELRGLLSSWFDVGFLELKRMTWNESASVLEKLVEYEAVHEITSWDDLKNRLDSDRRCYAFFHPNMPNEPLIFVEVALVNGMADNVHALLDERESASDPEQADTAIFYSISNAQAGLAGVSFGDFLIKRVVAELSREFPNLKSFATLSPIPGFRRWLASKVAGSTPMLDAQEAQAIAGLNGGGEPGAVLLSHFDGGSWIERHDDAECVKPILVRLGAAYLMSQRDSKDGVARAIDAVAHFHLSNGAQIERVNWLADQSANGLAQSAGLMVNYLYRLPDIERHHEAYRLNATINASSHIKTLSRS